MNLFALNCQPLLDKTISYLANWAALPLSLIGRIDTIKMGGLSKVYVFFLGIPIKFPIMFRESYILQLVLFSRFEVNSRLIFKLCSFLQSQLDWLLLTLLLFLFASVQGMWWFRQCPALLGCGEVQPRTGHTRFAEGQGEACPSLCPARCKLPIIPWPTKYFNTARTFRHTSPVTLISLLIVVKLNKGHPWLGPQ